MHLREGTWLRPSLAIRSDCHRLSFVRGDVLSSGGLTVRLTAWKPSLAASDQKRTWRLAQNEIIAALLRALSVCLRDGSSRNGSCRLGSTGEQSQPLFVIHGFPGNKLLRKDIHPAKNSQLDEKLQKS